MNPHDLSQVHLQSGVTVDERVDIDCECPFCKGKTFTYIKNLPYTDRTAFLRCHNWWAIERAAKELYKHSQNLKGLELCLRSRSPNTDKIDGLVTTLSLIDTMKNGDIEILKGLIA